MDHAECRKSHPDHVGGWAFFVEDLTQTEIAERVGISQMQVSRLLRRSLEQLRALTDAPGQAR